MARIAIGIEYDGSSFYGWQSQPALETVQGVLERAVSEIACEKTKVIAAGRTDAGVHALEQVAHFDTNASRPLQAWIRGVNRYLPPAVAVRWAVPVEPAFHARFSAISRSYRYVLFNHPVRPALHSGRIGRYHRMLDVGRMSAAARYLMGEHDFSSFRSSECQARSPVKTLHEASIQRNGDYVLFDFRAGGFLHHMVRNIIGTLLWVGYGKMSAEAFAELLAARDRTLAAPTFAPDGLYFVGAEYDEHWRLPLTGRIMAHFDPGRV
ncbi:MAG: tRNA pseudouridine(38-40) synthase TruA [Georgfuchsia sp.]